MEEKIHGGRLRGKQKDRWIYSVTGDARTVQWPAGWKSLALDWKIQGTKIEEVKDEVGL